MKAPGNIPCPRPAPWAVVIRNALAGGIVGACVVAACMMMLHILVQGVGGLRMGAQAWGFFAIMVGGFALACGLATMRGGDE